MIQRSILINPCRPSVGEAGDIVMSSSIRQSVCTVCNNFRGRWGLVTEQSGFTPGRSTIDPIVMLIEHHYPNHERVSETTLFKWLLKHYLFIYLFYFAYKNIIFDNSHCAAL